MESRTSKLKVSTQFWVLFVKICYLLTREMRLLELQYLGLLCQINNLKRFIRSTRIGGKFSLGKTNIKMNWWKYPFFNANLSP